MNNQNMIKIGYLIFLHVFLLYNASAERRNTFTVFENQEPNTPVGQILTQLGYTYVFNEPSSLFTLDPISGSIQTKIKIDREALSKDVIDLYIIERSNQGQTDVIDISIEIKDVNDNAPMFADEFKILRISEQVIPGSKYSLPSAIDLDKGINSVTSNYRIVSGNINNIFVLEISPGDSQIWLVVKEKLDREVQSSYSLNISAEDGGNPVNYGYLNLNVIVEDYNDNAPLFSPTKYDPVLNESSSIGTLVTRLYATDADLGVNSEISYRFKDTGLTSYKEFIIDPRSGQITLRDKFSCFKSTGSCFFIVEARDNGSPPLTSQAHVTVSVADDNTHAPSIDINLVKEENGVAIVERGEQSIKTPIAVISVQDLDFGSNGEVDVIIADGNYENHFEINRVSPNSKYFLLKIKNSLSDSSPSSFNLLIEARDRGQPPLSSQKIVKLRVTEANRHRPEFLKPFDRVFLNENSPIDSYVTRIEASDQDEGVNGVLFYRIVSGNERSAFTIDPNTGIISTVKIVDYEETSEYSLNVSVSDKGLSPLTSQAILRISIRDINDNAPEFKPSTNLDVEVAENRSPSVIYNFDVQDLDKDETVTLKLGDYDQIKYGDVFEIKQNKLYTMKALDFESKNIYILRVVAYDNARQPLSSTATLTVRVVNENDNWPYFYPPQSFLYAPTTNDNYMQPLAGVHGFDDDESVDYNLTFSFVESNSNFVVDSASGEVRLLSWKASDQREVLRIQATDSGGLVSKSPFVLYIYPSDLPGEKPSLLQKTYSFSTSEDIGTNFVSKMLGKVEGVRYDSLHIIDGDPMGSFSISANGDLFTVKSVDRELKQRYELSVVAVSNIGFATCVVLIDVSDVNEAPHFESNIYEFFIRDNLPANYVFGTINAIDRDEGANGNLSYSLKGTNASDLFGINVASGSLSLMKSCWMWSLTSVTVSLIAEDRRGLSAQADVRVNLIDTNNNSPVFTQQIYQFILPASDALHVLVGRVEATDSDFSNENNQITYHLVSDVPWSSRFRLFASGSLYVIGNIEAAEQSEYQVTVLAKDNGSPRRSSTATIIISVIDKPNTSPLFAVEQYNFTVSENLLPGSQVGMISAFDPNIGVNGLVKYRLVTESSNFSIDSLSGAIYTRTMFDKESQFNTESLRVIAFDTGTPSLSSTVRVSVTISDDNDHAPRFTNEFHFADIPESADVGETVIIATAQDLDHTIGGQPPLNYEIISGNEENAFDIESSTGRVFVNHRLDREKKSTYVLTLCVGDKPIAGSSLSSTSVLIIDILDINDVYPVFVDLTDTSLTVPENVQPGFVLFQLKSQDPDINNNGVTSFSILSGNDHSLFKINFNNGLLYLYKPLDYEQQVRHQLVVAVSDMGSPSLSTTTTLTISVTDINDNAPVFSSTTQLFELAENASLNHVVGQVAAVDKDSALVNQQLVYSLQQVDVAGGLKFDIHASTGDIRLIGALNREVTSLYNLQITCHDQGAPQMTATTTIVTIVVKDVDDEEPVIRTQTATLLPLSASIDSEVGLLRATDADTGDNARIQYHFHETYRDANYFTLQASTGALTLKQNLPESRLYFDIQFAVSNPGKHYSGWQDLRLIARSSSPNGLQFKRLSYAAKITENIDCSQMELISFQVEYHNNPGKSASFEYWITGVYAGNKNVLEPRGLFSLNKDSGQLYCGSVLADREATGTGQYEVQVTAMDVSSLSPVTTTITAAIIVLDQNDNAPRFSKPSIELDVSENIVVPAVIVTVEASDPDIDSVLKYSLRDTHEDAFQIHPDTGRVTVRKALDYERKTFYTVTVMVEDGVHTGEMTLQVTVTDENDNQPQFDPSLPRTWTVQEGVTPGSFIGRVRATDADQGSAGSIRYRLVNSDLLPQFQIDSKSGMVSTRAELDFDEIPVYLLVITAEDQDEFERFTSTVTITLNLGNMNDELPKFEQTRYQISLPENTNPNTTVLNVRATDRDIGSRIEYSIPSYYSQIHLPFHVHPFTGAVTLLHPLDREVRQSFTFIVQATDGLHRNLSEIIVTVEDINDSAPQFLSPARGSVRENAPNLLFHTLKCFDPDTTGPLALSYSIVEATANTAMFSVDSSTGELRSRVALDRESEEKYELTVSCTDGVHRTQQRLIIQVQDQNEFPPKFSNDVPLHLNINPGSPEPLILFTATDQDSGNNAKLRFFLIGNRSSSVEEFDLDPVSGALTTKSGITRLRSHSYSMSVLVTDCGDPSLSSHAAVTIRVTDIDFCAPRFINTPMEFSVTLPHPGESEMGNLGHILADNCGFMSRESAAKLNYFLKTGQEYFSLDATSGLLSLKPFQSEFHNLRARNEFLIKAVSSTGQSVESAIILHVLPTLKSPPSCKDRKTVFQVPENAPSNTKIGSIMSSEESNATRFYSFSVQSGRNYPIQIEGATGFLYVSSNHLDREKYGDLVSLVVLIVDSRPGADTERVSCDVDLLILDVNDNKPLSISKLLPITAAIPSESIEGTFVVSTLAWDPDSGPNGTVTYEIDSSSPDASLFQLSASFLFTKVRLPSQQANFNLDIVAQDQGGLRSIIPVRVAAVAVIGSIRFTGQPPTLLSIPENQDPKSLLATFLASYSGLSGSLTYRLVAVSGSGGRAYWHNGAIYQSDFAMDSQTGALTLDRSILGNGISQYEVIIRALVENEDEMNFIDHSLKIKVTPVSSDRKTSQCSPYWSSFSVREDLSPGRVFGKLTAKLNGLPTAGSQFLFRILTGNPSGGISIDESSGALKVGGSGLDRETVSTYNLLVGVKWGQDGLEGRCVVDITIEDVNEWPPRFLRSFFTAKVSELAPIGTFVRNIEATDADSGDVLNYELLSNPGEKFTINRLTGDLLLTQALDYEQTSRYELAVKVTDGLFSHKTGIAIEVEDVNDQTPEFTSQHYHFVVAQPALLADTTVGKVTAVDKDNPNSKNSHVIYEISGVALSAFHIHSETGIVKARSPESIQINHLYQLKVTASDQGVPPLSSVSDISIRIVDGSFMPRFSESKNLTIVALSGTAKVEQMIYRVEASLSNPNAANSSEISFTLAGGNASDLYSLDSFTGWISVKKELPVNSFTYHSLLVSAFYSAEKVMSMAPLNVILIRVPVANQKRLLINGDSGEARVAENTQVGRVLFNLKIENVPDQLRHLITVEFSISMEQFEIIETSLLNYQIILKAKLDYESNSLHRLPVVAKYVNGGLPDLANSRTVTLFVSDVNDSPPVFKEPLYTAYLFENSPSGSVVIDVTASDRDSPPHNDMKYSLLGPRSDRFLIDATTGTVTTKAVAFDYEQGDGQYRLIVEVRNPGTSLYSSCEVYVKVVGRNEAVLECERREGYEFTITQSATQSHTQFGAVKGSDLDKGVDGDIQYSLFKVEPAVSSFQIDSESGVLSTVGGDSQLLKYSRFHLHVLLSNPHFFLNVTDSSVCSATLQILGGNEAPKFVQPLYKVLIKEDMKMNEAFLRVEAKDRESAFTYRMDPFSSKHFSVNPATGDISAVAQLDREVKSFYNLTVAAVDEGSPPLTGFASILIYLQDVNNKGPEFHPTSHPKLLIQEGLNSGAIVGSLRPFTMDRDGPANGSPFRYNLLSSLHSAWFELKPNGLLLTKTPLDREATPELNLTVSVSDSGAPPITSQLLFTVVVDDVNDSPSASRDLGLHVTQYDKSALKGPVANFEPLDADMTGKYFCEANMSDLPAGMVVGEDCHVFVIGNLGAVSGHVVRVKHNDGVHAEVESRMRLTVNHIAKNIAEKNMIELVLRDTSMELHSLLEQVLTLPTFLKKTLGLSTSVLFAGFSLTPGILITSDWDRPSTRSQLWSHKDQISAHLGATVSNIRYDLCVSSCGDQSQSCSTVVNILTDQTVHYIQRGDLSVAYPPIDWRFKCQCKAGYVGETCDKVTSQCAPDYCRNGGACYSAPDGQSHCLCPPNFTGAQCEADINECSTSPCLHGNCANTLGGYSCQCHSASWFTERCNTPVNHCDNSPCKNGATCLSKVNGYHCRCKFGYYGRLCENAAWAFFEGSYLSYSAGSLSTYSVDMEVATSNRNALLFYHRIGDIYGLTVTIENGYPKILIDSESGQTGESFQIVSPQFVATGEWIRLTLVKSVKSITLNVLPCDSGTSECQSREVCDTNQQCSTNSLTIPSQLHTSFNQSAAVFLGGLPLSVNPRILSTFDLVGCLRRLTSSFGEATTEHAIRRDACPRPEVKPCSSGSSCSAVGSCVDEWFVERCSCPEGYEPPGCSKGFRGYSFSSSSVLMLSVRPQLFRSNSGSVRAKRSTVESNSLAKISLKVKTNSENCILLLAVSDENNYSFISIQDGHLVITDALIGKLQAERESKVFLSDSKIHRIELNYLSTNEIRLKIDQSTSSIAWSNFHNPLNNQVKEIYLSDVAEKWKTLTQRLIGFSGCMSELRFNENIVPFSGLTSRFNVSLLSGSVKSGCSSGVCSVSTCERGYSCEEVVDKVGASWGDSQCVTNGDLTLTQFILVIVVPLVLVIIFIIVLLIVINCIRRKRLLKKYKHKTPGAMVGPHKHFQHDKSFNLAYLGPIAAPRSIANQSSNSTVTTRSGYPQENNEHLYISKHIDRELSGRQSHQPDLLPPSDSIMILPSLNNTYALPESEDLYDYGCPPLHYDMDKMSNSLPPSDVFNMNQLQASRTAPWRHASGAMIGHNGGGVSPLGSGFSSLHSSGAGSRIYERLGSQNSTMDSHDPYRASGPRYPYAYRHRLQARVTPPLRGYTPDDSRRSSSRKGLSIPPPPSHPPPPAYPYSPHSSSGAPSIDSFTGSDVDESAVMHHHHQGEMNFLGSALPPPLPSSLSALRSRGWNVGLGNRNDEENRASLEPMLGWNNQYDHLVGVFQDLAGLPDNEQYV